MNSIELQDLKKTYKRRVTALDGLDLKVPAGCIFGLLGPNGAGKSTAINIMAGVVKKNAGVVKLLGHPIGDNYYEYKRRVGFVLENPHYIEKLTVEEYLNFAAAMYGIEKEEAGRRTRELIAFFKLEEKQNDWIESYSTGMKKKVSLAAAFIHRPQLLIMDEPFEGIDPVSARTIKENLRLMAEKNITILLSSHVLDTVEKLCDEIAIIHKGKNVLQAATKDLRQRIKEGVNGEMQATLEEIFIETVSQGSVRTGSDKLSWL
jgi:ABC-2 type transport system ATP-binding protein